MFSADEARKQSAENTQRKIQENSKNSNSLSNKPHKMVTENSSPMKSYVTPKASTNSSSK